MEIEKYEKLRGGIIKKVSNYFFNKSYINACWLGGSDANNETDEYSDIDLFFCIEDLKIDDIFFEIKAILLEIGKLDFESNINYEGNQQIKFFHIEGTPKSLIIDIGIISKSKGITFERGHPYFKPKIIFDKQNIIKFIDIDKNKLINEIEKFIIIQKDFVGQSARIETYINRGNYIEATNYYIKFIYLPLIAILRVRYTPYLYNWGRIHISRHFGNIVINKLEELMRFEGINDIENNLNICKEWFFDLINEIDREGINLDSKY